MSIVQRWSGRETRALREAMRMTLIEFADHLGVSHRTVSKWESGRATQFPAPAMQQVLDAALARCDSDVRTRFLGMIRGVELPYADTEDGQSFVVDSHKFIPLYVGSQAIDQLVSRASYSPTTLESTPCWSNEFDLDGVRRRIYAFSCGVIVAHVHEELTLPDLTSLAVWRYRTYRTDLPWLARHATESLDGLRTEALTPEYVLSAYVLQTPKWAGSRLDAALRLMCSPSVLVDRSDPENPCPAPDDVEASLLAGGFSFPEVVSLGVPGVSVGYAGWSGISYYATSPERALSGINIVECELLVQMLWCYSRRILRTLEEGRDPDVPEEYGWRFLRAARTRLTTARAQETSQHSLMRTAILDTSGLPHCLAEAQDALRLVQLDRKG